MRDIYFTDIGERDQKKSGDQCPKLRGISGLAVRTISFLTSTFLPGSTYLFRDHILSITYIRFNQRVAYNQVADLASKSHLLHATTQ